MEEHTNSILSSCLKRTRCQSGSLLSILLGIMRGSCFSPEASLWLCKFIPLPPRWSVKSIGYKTNLNPLMSPLRLCCTCHCLQLPLHALNLLLLRQFYRFSLELLLLLPNDSLQEAVELKQKGLFSWLNDFVAKLGLSLDSSCYQNNLLLC